MMENSFFDLGDSSLDLAATPAPNYQDVPLSAETETGDGVTKQNTSNIPVDPFQAGFNKALIDHHSAPKPFFEVTSYDPDIKERYKGDPSIYNDFFDPTADNERIAYENWDKWDAIGAGLGQMKDSFTSAFTQSAMVWPRVAKALFTFDADYLMPDQEEMEKMAFEQEKSRLENPIFYAPGTEDDFLTKGFLAESLANIGYTFGTLAEVGAEFAATTAVSGLLAATQVGAPAAAGLETAAAARAGTKLSSLFGKMSKFFTGAAVDDATKVAGQSSRLAKTELELGTSNAFGEATRDSLRLLNAEQNIGLNGVTQGINLWDNALKVAGKVPFVGELADAARLANAARGAGLTKGELLKLGAGGLRRSFAEWQMAAGEASIEAGANYAESVDHMTDMYAKENGGALPVGDELQRIKDIALKSATADFATNVAILGITNKIQWGNIMGKFNLDSAALTRIRTAIGSDVAADLGIIGVKNASKTKLYKSGLFGTVGLAPKIATDFGKKQAAWEVGKSLVKGITRLEISEGIQENMQEGSNEFLVNYYGDIYKKGVADWGANFEKAVDSQMTKRGLKTFMMGALTGVFVRPVYSAVQYAGERGGLNPNAVKHRQAIQQSIETLNKFYDNGSETILKEAVKQIKLQNMFNNGMVEGLLTKDKYQYFNNKDSALIQAVLHAKRTGTMPYFTEFIKGYGENMTNEEFKTAFGYTPAEMGYSSPKDVLNDIATSTSEFSRIYDKYQNQYGLILGVEDLINDPHSRQKFSIRRSALMDAITTAAFIESKSKQSIKRAGDIMKNITKYDSIGNSLASSFNTLVSPEKMDDNLLILENEIKMLQEGEQTDSTKKLIADKQTELQLLDQIRMVMYTRERIQDPTNPERTIEVYDTRLLNSIEGVLPYMAGLMGRYLAIKNKQNGINTEVLASDVNDAIKDIYDYMSLGQDHAEYVQAINLLNDPDNFTKYYENLMDARASAHARLLYEDYLQLADISEVARKWMDDNKELFDELLTFSKRPSGTFQNFIKLQDIRNKLDKAKDQLLSEAPVKEIEEQAPAQPLEKKEEEVKKEVVTNSRLPQPVLDLKEKGENDVANEYMDMRYDFNEIANTFPFESVDLTQRVVTRYYKDPTSGERIAYPNGIKIPVDFDFGDGQISMLNTIDNIRVYLELVEQTYYDSFSAKQQMSSAETDAKVDAVDNEKNKLANHIGNQVLINGVAGELQIKDGNYVVVTPTIGIIVLGEVKEDTTFDDIAELSIAYDSLPAEDKAIIKDNPNAIVDTQESGTVTISLDSNLETVEINGVRWTIEKNDLGLATALTREYPRKKGKSTKMIVERLSANNPKAADYVKRINTILEVTAAPLSDNLDDLSEELEANNSAIASVEKVIEQESAQRKKSDELLAQYRLNQLINSNTSPEITQLRAKFDNPLTRDQVTQDEMLTLFMWADDLAAAVKKQWSVYLTNPVVNGFLAELHKEYINPIAEKIDTDGRKTKPGRTVTARSASKKKRAEKLAEISEPRKGKRDTKREEEDVKPKKGRKRTVKSAVDAVETKAERKRSKAPKVDLTAAPAEKTQNLPVTDGSKIVNKLSATRINNIRNAITTSNTELPFTDINPFDSLNSKPSCEI